MSSIDRSRLSGFDLVVVMRARNRQLSHDQAEFLADMVEVSHCADAELGRLDEAFEAGMTTGQLRARIQRLCIEGDSEQARNAMSDKWRNVG